MQVTNYRLQSINCELQITNYKLQDTNYKLQVTSNKLQITGYKLKITSSDRVVGSYISIVQSRRRGLEFFLKKSHNMVKQCLLLGEFMPRIDKKLFRAVQATKEKQEKRTSPRKNQGHKSPSVAKKERASNKKEKISYLEPGSEKNLFVCKVQGNPKSDDKNP